MSHEPPIPVAVALSRVMETFDAVDGSEVVDLPCALGRILIEPLVAPVDVPALATSAMDGVALCARDIEGKALPLELTLLGRVLAGHLPDLRPGPGQCVRIMTGALLPEGCDTVVLQEDIVLLDGAVRIVEPVTPGANVRRPGEQWCSGDVCLDAGERLRPADLQTAAMLGLSPLRVRRAPRVAILSSGDEVQALGSSLHEGEVFDSNRQFLLAALAQLGVTVIDLGIVADAADLLATAVARAALEADLLLTTGGASQGDADHVAHLLDTSASRVFSGVAMKPGRPARLALYRDPATGKTLPVMALPGSPGAMMTAFYILARPALSKLLGERQGASWRLNATLIGSLRGARGRTQYIPASLHINQGALEVRPSSSAGASWRRPGVASRIDAYIELDGNDLTTPDGSIVTVVVV